MPHIAVKPVVSKSSGSFTDVHGSARLSTWLSKTPHPMLRSTQLPSQALLFGYIGGETAKTKFPRGRIVSRAVTSMAGLKEGQAAALNEMANAATKAMIDGNKRKAAELCKLLEHGNFLNDTHDMDEDTLRFLRVVQAMLQNVVLKEAGKLEGPYLTAFNRICNQVSGSEWSLLEEGKSVEDAEPSFSTWDDVLNKRSKGTIGAHRPGLAPGSTFPVEDAYYLFLGVETSATAAEIKAGFRQKALQLHPDVNDRPDAEARFMEVSRAYDVLYDAATREVYDRYGEAGLERAGAGARGSWREAWDEFKPFKKESRRTKARDTAASAGWGDVGPGEERLPQVGDVVEYPLREVEREELQDGRRAGVGLLVSRNLDRGDAARLPPELLDLCEVEALRQDEPGSNRWRPDDLGIPSFARLGELRVVPVTSYSRAHDLWQIDAALSEGCGGPDLPEEVML